MIECPLHIVHYLSSVRLKEGGVVRAVLDMCQIMASRGLTVTLLTADGADVPAAWRTGEAGVPRVVEISAVDRWGRLSSPAIQTARRLIAQASVLHLHTPWDPVNPRLAQCALQNNVAYVVTAHGMLDEWSMLQRRLKKRLYLALRGRRFLERAARVHCTAEAEMQQALAWCPAAKPWVLPLIFDLGPFEALPGPDLARQQLGCLAADKPNVLFLSRLHIKKGPHLLIDAAARLRDRGIKVNVILAGPGEESYVRSLRQRAAEANLDESLHFPGMVNGAIKFSLYEAADVFVLPTSQENFGLVLPEAMACRTPVVTTQGVDIWQELQSAGATIVPQESAAIAEAMARLLADSNQLRALGERGRAFVFEWLDSPRVAGRYEEGYREIASAR